MVPLTLWSLLVLVAFAPGAEAASNSFATLVFDEFPRSDGTATNISATATFAPAGGIDRTYRMLVSFHTQSDEVEATLDSVEGPGGAPVVIERRETQRQDGHSILWVLPQNATSLVLRGTAVAHANGRFQLGALLVPHDVQWRPVRSLNGTLLEIYEPATLSGVGIAHGPPFVGAGNVPAGAAPIVMAFVFAAVWSRRAAFGNS